MFNVTGVDAVLVQRNRTENNDVYDDENKQSVTIQITPINADMAIKYGTYTIPQATHYFVTKGNVDVKEGDELEYDNQTYSIIGVNDNWIWNHLANIVLVVK